MKASGKIGSSGVYVSDNVEQRFKTTYIHTHTYIHTYIHTYTHAHIHTCTHAHIQGKAISVQSY